MKYRFLDKAYLRVLLFRIKEKILEKWDKKSVRYGLAFFSLIPIFAIIYCVLPTNYWNQEANVCFTFWHSLYFSIVTITTLGFGDIYPVTTCSRFLVSLETIGGVIFIGLFLNALSTEQAKKVSELEEQRHNKDLLKIERNKLNLRRKMLETRINRYVISTYCVVTPIDKRDFKNLEINPSEIKFNDLYDMFAQTLLMTYDHRTSSLEVFLRNQNELFNEFSDILKEVNVACWPDLLIPINNFMTNCVQFDYTDSLLGIKNMTIGKEAASYVLSKYIKEHEGKVDYLPSNTMNQFVALYHLIVKNIKEVERIKSYISWIFDQEMSPSSKTSPQ